MREHSTKPWLRVSLALVLAGHSGIACAADLTATITGNGAPLADAVVSLVPSRPVALPKPAPGEMDQRNLQFAPHLLVVRVGTSVRFPNSDNIRHQVYSFSPAKTFELPLYSGKPSKPVVFDRAGVVELGCNIHDWMLGYVVAVDTPYYGVTGKDGRLLLKLPAGEYEMQVWHERQRAGMAAPFKRKLRIPGTSARQSVNIDVVASAPAQKPIDERTRKLQERFRTLKRGS